jgi:hypothetical protein
MNYNENLTKAKENLKQFLGEKISIDEFIIDELIYSKRVRTPGGPVIKIIKRTQYKIYISGIRDNPILEDQGFIYDLKKCLEDTFRFKFKRINVTYSSPDEIVIVA